MNTNPTGPVPPLWLARVWMSNVPQRSMNSRSINPNVNGLFQVHTPDTVLCYHKATAKKIVIAESEP